MFWFRVFLGSIVVLHFDWVGLKCTVGIVIVFRYFNCSYVVACRYRIPQGGGYTYGRMCTNMWLSSFIDLNLELSLNLHFHGISSAYFSVLAYGKLEKVVFLIESQTVCKELCYPTYKETLLTPLNKAAPAGRQASISKPRFGLIFIRFIP